MTALIISYILEIATLPSTLLLTPSLYSGIPLSTIFFSNPLPSTINQELNHLDTKNVNNSNIGLLTNLSKGLNAHEAYLEHEEEEERINGEGFIELLLANMQEQIRAEKHNKNSKPTSPLNKSPKKQMKFRKLQIRSRIIRGRTQTKTNKR